MTARPRDEPEALPTSCIRGPELVDSGSLSAEIRAADPAALAAYQRGIEIVIHARALLDAQEHLQELIQTRAFLLRQLRILERQNPAAFGQALAAFDRQPDSGPELAERERIGCDSSLPIA